MHANLLEENEAQRIAAKLAAKYGADALAFARSRAERAREVGDELAYSAWRSVLDATALVLGEASLTAP